MKSRSDQGNLGAWGPSDTGSVANHDPRGRARGYERDRTGLTSDQIGLTLQRRWVEQAESHLARSKPRIKR